MPSTRPWRRAGTADRRTARDGRTRGRRCWRQSSTVAPASAGSGGPPSGERLAELRHRPEPVGHHRRQRLPDRLVRALRQVGPHRPRARRRLGQPPHQHRLRRRPGERRLAGEHLVEHGGEAVEVGAGVEPLVAAPPAPGSCRRACRPPAPSRSASRRRPLPRLRAIPKSATSVLPSSVSSRFSGLMSRWMTPWPCAYWSACAASRAIRSASSTGSCRSRRSRSRRLSPST